MTLVVPPTEGPIWISLLSDDPEERRNVLLMLKEGYQRSVDDDFDLSKLAQYHPGTMVLVGRRKVVGQDTMVIVGTVALQWAADFDTFGRFLGGCGPKLLQYGVRFAPPALVATRACTLVKRTYLSWRAPIIELAIVRGVRSQAGLNLVVSKIPRRLRKLGYDTYRMTDRDCPTAPLKGRKAVTIVHRSRFETVLRLLEELRLKPASEDGGFPRHEWAAGSARVTYNLWLEGGSQWWLNPPVTGSGGEG